MIKLMHKKLNKKGFTLAELLVVIAILAILIAIAVPVFTHMVAEANLRVNQANVHSVRSAAVAHILTHMGDPDDSGDAMTHGPRLNSQIGEDNTGWVATAEVDNNGNINHLNVYVVGPDLTGGATGSDVSIESLKEGIGDTVWENSFYTNETATNGFYEISDTVDSPFATVKPSMMTAPVTGEPKVYYVQAIVTDLDPDND